MQKLKIITRCLMALMLALCIAMPGFAEVIVPANPLANGTTPVAETTEEPAAEQTEEPAEEPTEAQEPAPTEAPGEELVSQENPAQEPAAETETPAEEVPAEEEIPVPQVPVAANPMDEMMAEMSDDEAQDWYDELYARAEAYVPEQGVVDGGALRATGHETLGETEVEVLIALEDASMNENEMISSEGKINILLLGVDARPGQKTGRSDAIILCSVDVESAEIKMISFMRDMYVSIPDHNPNRLNTAYYWGGPDLLFETLADNFGVSVDYYVAVNFSILGSLIDQLGGLEIDITDEYFVDRINAVIENDNLVLGINPKDGFVKEAGLQLLTGKQAQAYARFRYGAKSGGDYARTGRQREVLMKIFEKVTQLSVPQLVELAMANIDAVDTNLALVDMVKLAPIALQMSDAAFSEMRVPADGFFQAKTINGMSVLLPEYDRINDEIRAFLE